MCGILGVFSKDSEEPIASHRLWHMIDAMKSRGPDGQHIWSHPGVSLGHLRLSILDLDARSDQPMVDPQSGRVITFNGEIYNYLELKHELLTLGYLFETTSDTEVILKAYDAWGSDCLNKFNGMWALAIYDPNEDTLFCARDRFGVKPFVYATSSEHLVFASESKAIVSGFPQFQKPDPDFLRYFVETGQFANTTATFYQPIQNLLPAHYFKVRRGEVPRPVRYWQWTPQVIQPVPSFGDAKEQFKELFKSAVSLRFRSDVPVGVCLSGGLDSTSVVATATQLFQKPIQTFSCIYPEFPEIDESTFIKQSVAKYHCESHTTAPVFDNFLELMTQSVWEQDGPTGGPTVLSQRAVMSLAKDYVTVLLDGQGGDEVLGGY
ncbi:MAG: asparagine synthase (glutamine-hydrolyzing), partial [Cyanobacteria bacterium]|nr:asparagine synthase (glutamine-hydrolyzing) [Cyanobacteriota bacterium]